MLRAIAAADKSSDVYERTRMQTPPRLRSFAASKLAPPAEMTHESVLVDLLLPRILLKSEEETVIRFPKLLA